MAIRQKPKKKVKTVRVLSDADPRRVSIVENGANQTPFREVKAAFVAEGQEENEDMAKNKARKSGAELVKVTFSKTKFKDVAAVAKWLSEKGYADTEATEDGEDFVVMSPEFSAEKSAEARIVEAEEGVQYHLIKEGEEVVADTNEDVAKAAAEAGDPEDEEVDDEPVADDEEDAEVEAAKAAKKAELETDTKELAEKVNQMRVYYSEKVKIADVLKEAHDGMPMGVGDLFQLFTKALANAAASGDENAVKSVSADFGDMFTEMMAMTAKFVASATADGEDVAKAAEQDSDSATVAKTDEEPEQAAAPKEEEASLEEQVVKAVAAAQAPLSTALEALAKTVGELADSVKATSERVSGLETVEQTRKGAAEEAAVTQKQDAKPQYSKLDRNIWGF